MKRKFLACLLALSIGLFSAMNVLAQEDTTTIGEDLKSATKKTGKVVKKGAKKIGNKTAEVASKGSSAIIDKIYEGKEGSDGQTIYINNKAKYYWVDKKGHRHFVTESELRDKD